MRAFFCSVLLAALVAPSAFAGNGNGQDKKALPPLGQPVTTLVEGPTPVSPGDVPAGGIAVQGALPGFATASCGACINTCWWARVRNGPSDWSGHIFIYQNLYWCGNGAAITYAQVSQDYDQQGAYTLTGAYGPWWSGGGLGAGNIRASGYILWYWRAPLVNWGHSDRTDLNSTMWAYGAVSF